VKSYLESLFFTGSIDDVLRYGSDAQCSAGTTVVMFCGGVGEASRRFSTTLSNG
jgi:hypothetical protein